MLAPYGEKGEEGAEGERKGLFRKVVRLLSGADSTECTIRHVMLWAGLVTLKTVSSEP